jgi:hypothetical protein
MLPEINIPDAIKNNGILNPKKKTLMYSNHGCSCIFKPAFSILS